MQGGSRKFTHRRVLAHHLIVYAYGGWLSNDPRGSGSMETKRQPLEALGPVHTGRKPDRELPSPAELRAFYAAAEPRLTHPTIWFDEPLRDAIAQCFTDVIRARGYTCYACAILQNHAHLLIRVHRDSGRTMWDHLTHASRERLRELLDLPTHPIWASRPYSVFKNTPRAIETCIPYIQANPQKHRLAPQHYPFVVPYDGWPWNKRGG